MSKFVDCLLLGSWTKKKLRIRTRVKYITFIYLCERLDPYLKKNSTRFRVIVTVQEKVAILLHKLGGGDGLQNISDLYGVHKKLLSK